MVTGASGGIGRAVSRRLSRAGYYVVGVDREPAGGAADVDRYVQADLSTAEAVVEILASVKQQEQRLDVLVNNAAVQISKPVVETTVDDWDEVMSVNLRAAFLLARDAYPLLVSQGGGAIVNVGSVHAVASSANIAAYAASKGGLLALTRALAVEFAPAKIRVNVVLPGAVDTPMLEAGLGRGHLGNGDTARLKAELARRTVNGRIGQPEEIAEAVLFLADEKTSAFVTGQSLVVDGGVTAHLSSE